jgi:hypothetical protein
MKLTSFLSLSALSLTLIFSASCKKDEAPLTETVPTADFTFDKGEYTDGQTMVLTSNSTDAATLRWTTPEGTTGKGASFSYAIPRDGVDRNLNFRLEAISASGLKSDYIVKSVKVKPARGKLVFYGGYSSSTCAITLDGVKVGDFTLPYNSFPIIVPDCDAAGYPTVTPTVGKHIVTYQYGSSFQRTKEVTVSENACTALQLD